MVLYRDHRGTLKESMETFRVFKNTDEMLEYVGRRIFSTTGEYYWIEIEPKGFSDNRIGWNNIHHVLAGGCIVGMCNLEEAKE